MENGEIIFSSLQILFFSPDSNKMNVTSRALIGSGSNATMSHTVMCQNGEFLLAHLWCDGAPDCRDLSDEHNCSTGTAFVVVNVLLNTLQHSDIQA